MLRVLFSFFLLLSSGFLHAESIQSIRISNDSVKTRLVFDLDSLTQYKTLTLSNPERLVVDLKDYNQKEQLAVKSLDGTPIKGIRYSSFNKTTLRVVLDLKHAVDYQTQMVAPQNGKPYRLVLDLSRASKKPTAPVEQTLAATPASTVVDTPDTTTKPAAPQKTASKPAPTPPKNTHLPPRRDLVIAIDPGHGGKDPGAIGAQGTKEKDIALAIAKRLAAMVDNEPGMRAYLTRDKDVFISLRERTQRAHQHGADMFISIHADAFSNRNARGSSVYVLSERGASSEAAQILANRENAADLAGGITLEDKDDLLASVLLDLSQTASLEASLDVGNSVLSGLKQIGSVHKKQVESAAFMVLKSPDIPSVLVETAFISNPQEEKNLKSASHQTKLAQAMLAGIRNYFHNNPLPGVGLPQQHIVSNGDTLSGIAERYQVSMADLKYMNNLSSSSVHVGDVLAIP